MGRARRLRFPPKQRLEKNRGAGLKMFGKSPVDQEALAPVAAAAHLGPAVAARENMETRRSLAGPPGQDRSQDPPRRSPEDARALPAVDLGLAEGPGPEQRRRADGLDPAAAAAGRGRGPGEPMDVGTGQGTAGNKLRLINDWSI